MCKLGCSPQALNGEFKKNEPMGRYTSFQAGGHAEYFFRPKDVTALCFFLEHLAKDVPVTWLGLGSNVLVQDGGIEGAVICTRNVLGELRQKNAGHVYAQAGVSCAKLSKFCIKNSLVGGEFFAGIPGTVGGALAMNAGAFEDTTWAHVVSVEIIDRQGRIETKTREAFDVAYRAVSIGKNQWFLAATLHFELSRFDPESCESGDDNNQMQRNRVRALLDKRNHSQPIGTPSFGSVFKNPQGNHAGALIEQCGLKGTKIGGAYVSEKHGNFILNDGSATATDALALIRKIMSTVQEQQGVLLEPEVRLLGCEVAVS